MYEIPYNVKRALKVGNLRKNYKMIVSGFRAPGWGYAGYIYANNLGEYANYEVPKTGLYGWGGSESDPPDPGSGGLVFVTGLYSVYRNNQLIQSGEIKQNQTLDLLEGDVVVAEVRGQWQVSYGSLWFDSEEAVEDPEQHITIDNDNIIQESVKIDDRMCSGKYLTFGLCEGASLEFQYFGFPNIVRHTVQVFLSVEYFDDNNARAWYDIPMGWFTIDECPMQFDTGIYKAVGYNKLKSSYLDQKANAILIESVADPNQQISFGDIRHILLQNYEVKEEFQEEITIPETGAEYYCQRFGPQVTLKGRYGIDTYFSMANTDREGNLTITRYPIFYCLHFKVTLETGKSYILQQQRDMSAEERNLYAFVKKMLGDAVTANEATIESWLHGAYPKPTSEGSAYGYDYIGAAYSGWKSACHILYYHGGTSEIYSTVGKETGETVAGKLEDISAKTIVGADGDYIEVSWPLLMTMYQTTDIIKGGTWGTFLIETVPQSGDSLAVYHRYRFWKDASYTEQGYGYQDYFAADGGSWTLNQDAFNDKCYKLFTIDTTAADDIQIVPADLADITLREATSAVYELSAQFGQLDRVTDLFSGVELNGGGLYPAETLYPASGLYPNRGGGNNLIHPFPSEYQKLWTDTGGVQSFRYLIITYKGLVSDEQGNQQEADLILQRTVNADGTTDYNCSSNWLFRNMVWTEEQVGEFADAMADKMRDIRWFPFEMWAAGLPYVDVGDAIEISDKTGKTYRSYILQRQLDGIHNLQDTFINGELDVF